MKLIRQEKLRLGVVIGVVALLGIQLSGCSKNKDGSSPQEKSKSETAPQKPINTQDLNAGEQSDELTRLAEIALVRDSSAVIADSLLVRALELNPNNQRAHFFRSLSRLAVETSRFLLAGVKGYDFEQSISGGLISYQQDLGRVLLKGMQDLYAQKGDGAPALATIESSMQAIRKTLVPAIKASLLDLKMVKDPVVVRTYPTYGSAYKIQLNVDSNTLGGALTPGWCNVDETGAHCEIYGGIDKVTVQSQDRDVLALAMSGFLNYGRVVSAYHVTGLEKVSFEIDRIRSKNDKKNRVATLTPYQLKNVLDQYPEFLTLVQENELNEVVGEAEKIAEQLLAWNRIQDHYCNNDKTYQLGGLFSAICVSDLAAVDVSSTLDILQGKQRFGDLKDTSQNILLDVPGFLAKAPVDIKALLPSGSSVDYRFAVYPDYTFGGLFPQSDFIAKAQKNQDSKISFAAVAGIPFAVKRAFGLFFDSFRK